MTADNPTVEVWRIFTREDGKTSMEAVQAPVGQLLAGKVQFQRIRLNNDPRWHTAPRRQITATISGSGEIETGDGQVINLAPGVVLLLEDLTGEGHITRTTGDTDRFALFLPIDDETIL